MADGASQSEVPGFLLLHGLPEGTGFQDAAVHSSRRVSVWVSLGPLDRKKIDLVLETYAFRSYGGFSSLSLTMLYCGLSNT